MDGDRADLTGSGLGFRTDRAGGVFHDDLLQLWKNLEILAYLFWPGLAIVGRAFAEAAAAYQPDAPISPGTGELAAVPGGGLGQTSMRMPAGITGKTIDPPVNGHPCHVPGA